MEENYSTITKFPKLCFKFVGVGILNDDWNPIKLSILLILLITPIINGSILAVLRTNDLKVFSTCIYVNFPNVQVLLKLVICIILHKNCNEMFNWIKNAFSTKYNSIVDNIWIEISRKCIKYSILFTR